MSLAPSQQSAIWVSLPQEVAVKFSNGELYSRPGGGGRFDESMVDDVDVLVLDGLKSSGWDSWFGLALGACSNGCKVILVTAAQVKIDDGQLLLCGGTQVVMEPWILEEYHEACKYDPFFQRVVRNLGGTVGGASYTAEQKAELVQRKFVATSGFSARWTFDITAEKAVELSIIAMKRCSDPRVTGVWNTCSFVCRSLAGKCESQFIVAAYAFRGWVLELDFLDNSDDSFQCSEAIDFVDESFATSEEEEEIRKTYPGHCWFIPRKFDNRGFDAVQLLRCEEGPYKLRFLQVTRAKTHGIDLNFMKRFADAYNTAVDEVLRATAVEIIIVTDMHSVKYFVTPTHAQVLGSLSEYNWNLSDLVVAGFNKTLF
eukprot:gene40504-54772_t